MEMGKFFEFFAIVPEIPCRKHHKIQEFAKIYHISAMKIKGVVSIILLKFGKDEKFILN
jgi:hypothetical protein